MESEKSHSSQAQQSFDLYKCMAWLHANRKALIAGAVVLAVIGSAIGIYSLKKSDNESQANEKFFALPPVFGGGEKAVHPSAAELSKVAEEFPGTSIGEQAQLLAAGTLFTQASSKESFVKAQDAFQQFLNDHPNSVMAPQASIGVAASAEAAGSTTNAITLYKQAISKHPNSGIVEPAKLTLARLLDEQGNYAEAFAYYEQLTAVPSYNNPWYSEAQERKALLVAKHPDLVKKPATPAPTVPSASPVQTQAAPATPKAQTNTPGKTK